MFISNSKSYGNHIINANKIKVSRTKVYIKEKENNNQYLYVKTPEGLKCLVLNMDEKLISMCYKIKPSVFRELMYQ